MTAKVGSTVHPKYKGIAEWQIKQIAELSEPIVWDDPTESADGKIRYDPKILQLSCPKYRKVLWFTYWIATPNTKGKLAWGERPPMLEEDTFLKLLKSAIKQDFFNKGFLKMLKSEIESALSK